MGFAKDFYPRFDKKADELVFVLHTKAAGVWDREYCNAQDVWEFIIGGEFDKICDLTLRNVSSFLTPTTNARLHWCHTHSELPAGRVQQLANVITELSFELREKILHCAATMQPTQDTRYEPYAQ
jgi:hypothetical protein